MNDGQLRLLQIIQGWVDLATPIAAQDPAAAAGATGYGGPSGLAVKLRDIVATKSLEFAQAFVSNNLAQATANLNLIFGSKLTLGTDGFYYSSPATAPTTAMLPPSVYESTPTVEQVAGFGSGVDFSTVDPVLVEAAAAIAPDSQAAEYLAVVNSEPVQEAPIEGAQVVYSPVPATAPPPAVALPAPLNEIPVVQTTQPVGDLAAVSFAAKLAPAQTTEVPTMAVANYDPTYSSAYSTSLPGTGVQASVGSDLLSGLAAGLGTLAGGGNIGQSLLGGLTGAGILPAPTGTGTQTPGFVGPTQPDQGLLNQLLALLGSIPGGQIPAALISGAQSIIGNGTQAQVTVPSGLGQVTAGLPMAPVMNATQTVTYRAPKGYVVVDLVGSNGQTSKVAMWKPMARSLKLWKARAKPPIKASEWKALKTAERVSKKAKSIAMKAGYSCRQR